MGCETDTTVAWWDLPETFGAWQVASLAAVGILSYGFTVAAFMRSPAKPAAISSLDKGDDAGKLIDNKNDDSDDATEGAQALMDVIKRRRSIFPKDYDGTATPRAHIELMLEAANWAPTHGKTEPWRFTVLEGPAKEMFMDTCFNAMKAKLGGARSQIRYAGC